MVLMLWNSFLFLHHGISDGFAIYPAADLLAAFLDVAFHHNAFYKRMDVFVQLAAVHNLFDDTYLLFMLFVGIAVVGINDAGRDVYKRQQLMNSVRKSCQGK